MKCSEFNKLDAATKKAVVNAILEGEDSILGPENVDIARSLAEAVPVHDRQHRQRGAARRARSLARR